MFDPDVAYALPLWDTYGPASEHCRWLKQTVKALNMLVEERAVAEVEYAKRLQVVAQQCNLSSAAPSSLSLAVESIRSGLTETASLRLHYAHQLRTQGGDALLALSSRLKAAKSTVRRPKPARARFPCFFVVVYLLVCDCVPHLVRECVPSRPQLDDRVERCGKVLAAATVQYQEDNDVLCRYAARVQELQSRPHDPRTGQKLSEAKAHHDQALQRCAKGQAAVEQHAQRHQSIIRDSLQSFGRLHKLAVDECSRVLEVVTAEEHRVADTCVECCVATLPKIAAVDAVQDVASFVALHQSGRPCPWPVNAMALSKSPVNAASSSASATAETPSFIPYALPTVPTAPPAISMVDPFRNLTATAYLSVSDKAPPVPLSSAPTAAATVVASTAAAAASLNLELIVEDFVASTRSPPATQVAASRANVSDPLSRLVFYQNLHEASLHTVDTDGDELKLPTLFPDAFVDACLQRRDDWAELQFCPWRLSPLQSKLVALELFLLSSNCLADFPEGNRAKLEHSLRLGVLLPRAEFVRLCSSLSLASQRSLPQTTKFVTQEAMLYVPYRFALLRQRLEPDAALRRQSPVVAASVVASDPAVVAIDVCRFCEAEMPIADSLEGLHHKECPRYNPAYVLPATSSAVFSVVRTHNCGVSKKVSRA